MVPISALSYYESKLEEYYVHGEPEDFSEDTEEFDEDGYYDNLRDEIKDESF